MGHGNCNVVPEGGKGATVGSVFMRDQMGRAG